MSTDKSPAKTTTAPAEQTMTTARPTVQDAIQLPRPSRLPYHPSIQERFGIDPTVWKALVEAIFPTATSMDSVVLALSYCKARKLDPFKRNVHIVPIYDSATKSYRDTIWPGIGELRTTAFRTGEYAGRGDTNFGPTLTQAVGSMSVTFPEWAQVTVSRVVRGQVVAFSGPKVYWLETYATVKYGELTPNTMWADRPFGQLEKCAEAAALRAAFPEEVGCDFIPDEVQHQRSVDASFVAATAITGKETLESVTEKLTQQHAAPATDDRSAVDKLKELEVAK